MSLIRNLLTLENPCSWWSLPVVVIMLTINELQLDTTSWWPENPTLARSHILEGHGVNAVRVSHLSLTFQGGHDLNAVRVCSSRATWCKLCRFNHLIQVTQCHVVQIRWCKLMSSKCMMSESHGVVVLCVNVLISSTSVYLALLIYRLIR
mgnify:CR=1 FL=1